MDALTVHDLGALGTALREDVTNLGIRFASSTATTPGTSTRSRA